MAIFQFGLLQAEFVQQRPHLTQPFAQIQRCPGSQDPPDDPGTLLDRQRRQSEAGSVDFAKRFCLR